MLRSLLYTARRSRPDTRFMSVLRDASNIGFVGIGNMGAPMATNLAKFGHRLIIYDRDLERAQQFASIINGAECVDSPREVAEASRVVITMLPGSKEVQEAYLDPKKGLFCDVQPRSLFVDCSTIEPVTAKELSKELLTRNEHADFFDAPVSGGVVGAVNRTLTFMVGGSERNVKQLESLLKCMGSKIVPCGEVGNGQIAKVCNNLILGVTMAAVSEAMSLATKLGMDTRTVTDVVNGSSGRCWSTDTYHPVPGIMDSVPASREYENGFACDLMVKDLGIALKEAKRVGAHLPAGLLVSALYKSMGAKGLGKKDFGVIYQHYYLEEKEEDTIEEPTAVEGRKGVVHAVQTELPNKKIAQTGKL